jgi:hypothetical protein
MKQIIIKRFFFAGANLAKIYSQFICEHFKVDSVDNLHYSLHYSKLEKGNDQGTNLHKAIYSEFDKDLGSELVKVYRELQLEWLIDLRSDTKIKDWAIQRYPSLRIQLPGNISVFEFHRDSDYMHPLGELNHFLSITKSEGTAALHIEEDLGWDNYNPLILNPGESAIINTSIFKHGDMINQENYTRFSIDFRAIPVAVLEQESGGKSITKGKIFDCSEYFISSVELT